MMRDLRDPQDYPFAGILFRIMTEQHLTPDELAARCGIAATSVRGYLSGRGYPTARTLRLIAAATGASGDRLLGL